MRESRLFALLAAAALGLCVCAGAATAQNEPRTRSLRDALVVQNTAPTAERFVSEDGATRFVLERSGRGALLRFNGSFEVFALSAQTGAGGDIVYRNDVGEQVARVTSLGFVTLYTPSQPGGVLTSLEGPAPPISGFTVAEREARAASVRAQSLPRGFPGRAASGLVGAADEPAPAPDAEGYLRADIEEQESDNAGEAARSEAFAAFGALDDADAEADRAPVVASRSLPAPSAAMSVGGLASDEATPFQAEQTATFTNFEIGLDQAIDHLRVRLLNELGRTIDVDVENADRFDDEDAMTDAVRIATLGILEAVGDEAPAVGQLRAVEIVRAEEAGVSFASGRLVVGVNPDEAYRGRPSSIRVRLAFNSEVNSGAAN